VHVNEHSRDDVDVAQLGGDLSNGGARYANEIKYEGSGRIDRVRIHVTDDLIGHLACANDQIAASLVGRLSDGEPDCLELCRIAHDRLTNRLGQLGRVKQPGPAPTRHMPGGMEEFEQGYGRHDYEIYEIS